MLFFADRVIGDPDTYWHIAVGRWIIAHRAVPHEGIFSATMPHVPWVTQEWLAEIGLAWLFDLFGWTGLVVATALCVAMALAMLLRVLLRSLEPVHALIATVLAYFLTMPHILARPHIFTLPILVAWVAALVRARGEDRAPSPWLALLMILWANLHGGYVFGVGLAALLGGEAVLLAADWPARLRAARGWAIFGGLLVIAALITPYGIDGLLLPFRISQMSFALAQVDGMVEPQFPIVPAARSMDHGRALRRVLARLAAAADACIVGASVAAPVAPAPAFGELLGFCAPLLVASALAPQLSRGSDSVLDRFMAALAKPAGVGGAALAGALMLAISGGPAARRRRAQSEHHRADCGARRGQGGSCRRPCAQRSIILAAT